MYKKTLRPAIAMIELIFAIVIMGIVLMSAPMLISTATKSGYVTIQQEAINEAASQINMIIGYHWDENDTDEMYLDPILVVSATGSSDLNILGTTGRRRGTPKESYRTFIRSDGTDDLSASTSPGSETGETAEDDIDDFIGNTILTLEDIKAGNIETDTINISTAISYSTDTVGGYNQSNITYNPFTSSGGATTNIKSITVTLTSIPSATVTTVPDELDKEIVLRAFSCNIGGYKLEEKSF